jgi:hypothetical protein
MVADDMRVLQLGQAPDLAERLDARRRWIMASS